MGSSSWGPPPGDPIEDPSIPGKTRVSREIDHIQSSERRLRGDTRRLRGDTRRLRGALAWYLNKRTFH